MAYERSTLEQPSRYFYLVLLNSKKIRLFQKDELIRLLKCPGSNTLHMSNQI